jgi:hypothetical protein
MAFANLGLNLQRQLFARSERVKGIDFHPTGMRFHLHLLTPAPISSCSIEQSAMN